MFKSLYLWIYVFLNPFASPFCLTRILWILKDRQTNWRTAGFARLAIRNYKCIRSCKKNNTKNAFLKLSNFRKKTRLIFSAIMISSEELFVVPLKTKTSNWLEFWLWRRSEILMISVMSGERSAALTVNVMLRYDKNTKSTSHLSDHWDSASLGN